MRRKIVNRDIFMNYCSLTSSLTQEKVENFKEMFQMFDKVRGRDEG